MDRRGISGKRVTSNKHPLASKSIKEEGFSKIERPGCSARESFVDMSVCDHPYAWDTANESKMILNLIRIEAARLKLLRQHVNKLFGTRSFCDHACLKHPFVPRTSDTDRSEDVTGGSRFSPVTHCVVGKSSDNKTETTPVNHSDDQKVCLVCESQCSVKQRKNTKLNKKSLIQLQRTLDLILEGVTDMRMIEPIGYHTIPIYAAGSVSTMCSSNMSRQNCQKEALRPARKSNSAPVKTAAADGRKIDEMGKDIKEIISKYKELVDELSPSSVKDVSGKNSNHVSYFDDSKFYDNFSCHAGVSSKTKRKMLLNRKHKSRNEHPAHTCVN